MSQVFVVTGANKGIGLGIVQALLKEAPPKSLIYLCSRDEQRGREAIESLKHVESESKVEYAQLDISSETSIKELAKEMKSKHDKVSVLVNNAGIATKGSAFDSTIVKNTLATNYYGTRQICLEFLPIVSDRIVNVSSMASKLGTLKSDELRAQFRSKELTLADCDALMDRFQKAVDQGTHSKEWPTAAYSVSKMGVTCMTGILARENPNLLINSCCPGYVSTSMSSFKGHLTVEQGAETPTFLAIGDLKGQTGLFWEKKRPSQW